MLRRKLPATLMCDFYKVSHKEQYPTGTEYIYSTFTPRSNKYFPVANAVVVFGIQAFVKKYMVEYFNKNFFKRSLKAVVKEYQRFIYHTLLNPGNVQGLSKAAIEREVVKVDCQHIIDLHELGYLPLELKALPEGTLAPIKVPVVTLENTKPRFFWLTNYFETLMSNMIWQPMTSATIAYQYRKLLDEFALKTTGSTAGVEFQGHDFSMRGMSSLETTALSGAGHLLSFVGTDSIPAITFHEEYYNANIEYEVVGTSIPATEHSVMCSYGPTNEFELFKHLITKVYPNGFFSVVSDTWDFWKVVTEYLPKLEKEIMGREGRVVIRPDSGDPVKILVGNVYPLYSDLEEASEDLYYEMKEEASKDCEGSHNCGNDTYTRRCQVGDSFYKITAEFEYNRYDKTYYYVETGKVKKIEEFTPTAEDKGLIQCLWETFGGTLTEKGYKLLDTHIGAIYGDSITLERARQIVEGLAAKGFASTNIVFGIGSYTYQMNTRDTFGFAMKATWAQVNGEERLLFKDPKTDDGTKKSQRGRVMVFKGVNGLFYQDGLYKADCDRLDEYRDKDQLQVIFKDGYLHPDAETSLAKVRELLHS